MAAAQVTNAPGARRVPADEIAQPFVKEIQESTSQLPTDKRPKLVGFLANSDPAAQKYAEWTGKTFRRDGMEFEVRQVETDDLEQALEEANLDQSVSVSNADDFELTCKRAGVSLSWDQGAAGIDVDLQALAFSTTGKLLDAVYYNNMKAFRGGLWHSGDELTGEKAGHDEEVWINFGRLPADVKLLLFVVACYKGGHLCDVPNGKYHVLEEKPENQVYTADLEQSGEEVDLFAALIKGDDGVWRFRSIHEPAGDGQHFIDILEPTIGNVVREIIPQAPRRIKAAFAMEKGECVDLPKSDAIKHVKIGLGWDPGDSNVDLDASALLLQGMPGCGRIEFQNAVFFNQTELQGIVHSGDNLTGEGEGDDEVITVDLEGVSESVQQLVFTINIYTPGKTFSLVRGAYARIFTEAGDELARYSLSEAGNLNGLVVARLSRAVDGLRWSFQALGQPCTGRTFKDSTGAVEQLAAMPVAHFGRDL